MTSSSQSIPAKIRMLAIQAARQEPGVREIYAPTHSIWKELAGKKVPEHDLLRLSWRGDSVSAQLDIGLLKDANALEVAGMVQQRIHAVLADYLENPDALNVDVTVL
ncbi:hypothetical protein CQ018_06895 [Arthrobacter sp. MYb227]|uniref:hypothetical protein n=1 Tax=Arthrobacter sp. MYb227 TaxID=1848601 RepID=UPI000CFCE4CF|nr:hypothetical protein [Arthrobacter sp. MYb227]PQZ95046.1 hypothetical protein CQ018_06895 [Arthrobacter sp. MYb227]